MVMRLWQAGQTSKSSKGKNKKGHHDHYEGLTCWNCNQEGHISCFCKKPRKSKKKDNPSGEKGDGKPSGSGGLTANVVEVSHNSEEKGAWAVIEEVEGKLDWFEEAVEEARCLGKGNIIQYFGDMSGEALITCKELVCAG